MRSFFITIQFTLAIILMCVSIVLNSQINYMKSASLGFEKDNVLVAKLDLAFKDEKLAATQFDVIINALKNNPYIRSFSTSQVIPTAYDENYNEYFDVESNKKISLRQVGTDAGYTTTFKIPIIAGRNFNNDLAATEGKNILLNRTAVKAFGWTKPIGKHIKGSGGDDTYTVVGVMEDFHYSDLQQPIGPLIQWYSGKQGLQNNRYLSVHFAAGHSKDISSMVENEFKKLPSRRSFTFHFMNELVDNQYALLTGILKITNYIALLTIGIACMGMFGLVALFAQRRVKEIGVRKVLGASVLNITSLLSKDFIKLVAIAVVVASPIAWWLMTKWLLDFSYRIDIRWWMFALAGVVAILIAVVTVSFQAIKAALVNPVTSLRTE